MAKSLFVGNLPWSVTEDELKAKFEEHANVLAVRLITDKFTGKAKGFGFVEVDDSDMDKVISAMNGQKIGDREIVVNEAKPRAERSDRGDRPRRNF
ncbi:RNA recognition motif domain-containing protein [Candidatus Margulisiibacteriota bacterium]